MTRLQEIPWVEELTDQTQLPRPRQDQVLPIRLNLFRIPWLRAVLANRWPQLGVRVITLLGFLFTIFTALSGTRVGSHNFAIIMVWITWWSMLKLGFIPLGGRA